jgi:hypothetical protein
VVTGIVGICPAGPAPFFAVWGWVWHPELTNAIAQTMRTKGERSTISLSDEDVDENDSGLIKVQQLV